jgi:hypothetical protein
MWKGTSSTLQACLTTGMRARAQAGWIVGCLDVSLATAEQDAQQRLTCTVVEAHG